jgi:purine nucleoside permease
MTLHPEVVILPAFTEAEYTGEASEVEPWLDRYEFDHAIDVAGVDQPVRHASDPGISLVPTGIGKSAAATTVSAIAAGDDLALDEATIVTVGIAGCPPDAGTLGSVFITDWVVDWDIKLRTGDTTAPMQWLTKEYVWQLNTDLVDRAAAAAREVTLADSNRAAEIREGYDDSRSPAVDIGPTVCGDEVYHGAAIAAQVDDLCESYGVDGFVTTEMEDAGTATALERFGLLDQYICIRAAANFDREPEGGDPAESIDNDVFDLGIENAVRVGQAVVADLTK